MTSLVEESLRKRLEAAEEENRELREFLWGTGSTIRLLLQKLEDLSAELAMCLARNQAAGLAGGGSSSRE